MPKLPRTSGQKTVAALNHLGFVTVRQRGSHVILRKETASSAIGTVVPMHKELAPGTLRGILQLAGVSVEEFLAALAH
ncbi:MAG: type II toxin-antitoxin system HicA family toxin [Terriglobales bacterium]